MSNCALQHILNNGTKYNKWSIRKITKIILWTLWTNKNTKGHMPHEIEMSLEVT